MACAEALSRRGLRSRGHAFGHAESAADFAAAPSRTALGLLRRHKIEKLPIVDGDGRLKGLITVKDIEKAVTYPEATKDAAGRLRLHVRIDERTASFLALGLAKASGRPVPRWSSSVRAAPPGRH